MKEGEKSKEEEFIRRIEALDAGELAVLRRAVGARDCIEGRCPWLLGFIQGATTEAVALLVASLLAQYSTTDIRSGRHRLAGDFGRTWRKAVAGSSSESLSRRFNVLLDSEFDPYTGEGDLPYRLRQMVRYAASKDVGVDWPQLAADLRHWNHPDRFVQKRWARSFFASDAGETSVASNERERSEGQDSESRSE